MPGIDYADTFYPNCEPLLQTILSIIVTHQWPITQLDVKNAFIHGHLQEMVYTQQPPGFRDPTWPDHICLLWRSLYELKQTPRAWF